MDKLKTIRSSTLMETIVAMVIIVTVSVTTVFIVTQVLSNGVSAKSIKAEGFIARTILFTQQEHSFFNESYEADGFIIEKSVDATDFNENLYWVKITIYAPGRKIINTQNIYLLATSSQ